MSAPATVAIPTRNRPAYLDVALSTIVPQARAAGAEVLVVAEGRDAATAAVAAAHGAVLLDRPAGSGANVARNLAIDAAGGELIVFTDDDVAVVDGWLTALLHGAERYPDHGVFGGPIVPVLEHGPRACGREPAPITALDRGPADTDVEFVWGANMAIRSDTAGRVGHFDERLEDRGEEEEWLERYLRSGGRIRYLAAAGVQHRRTGADSGLRALSRAQYAIGRSARHNDARKLTTPTLRQEFRDLAGAGWHALRHRCAYGVVFAAHAAGRIEEALDPQPQANVEPFLSGESGSVAGLRGTALARLSDATADMARAVEGRRLRADARAWGTSRNVLALTVSRPEEANLLDANERELRASRHQVRLERTDIGDRGKFENLNLLLGRVAIEEYDWLLVIDDDVRLPRDFLDTFLFLAERYELDLAQPAHRRYSHAAWRVTRRRRGSAVRETQFVEIGPVTAFRRSTFETLLPFPPLRAGWGLELHWAALAAERGWRLGVTDAVAIEHALRPVAAAYDSSDAVAEARAFLADRAYVDAAGAQRTLETHRGW